MALPNFFLAKATPVSIALRGVQILFALFLIILGAVAIDKLPYRKGYPATAIVSGIFSLLIYVPLFFAPALVFFTPVILLALEVFASLWWLIAFACSADLYGDLSCGELVYGVRIWGLWRHGCQAGKAIIAFGVLGWLLSLVTIALLVGYSILPVHKQNAWNTKGYFSLGGIFPKLTVAPGAAGAVDPEATVGERSVESGDEFKTTGEAYADPYPESGVAGTGTTATVTTPYPAESSTHEAAAGTRV